MEIKTQYNIGDMVTLDKFRKEKLLVTAISVVVHKDEINFAYKLEAPTGANLGYYAESHLTFISQTVDKSQCAFEVTIDIKDIYGLESIEIPTGYKFKTFKPPEIGEIFLDRFTVTPDTCNENFDKDSPRIILEQIKNET